jgi:hypothetical protein
MIGGGPYIIEFKQSAKSDLVELEKFIVEDCLAPLTAKRRLADLDNRLDWLEKYAELPAIDFNLSYQYGLLVRTIPYGKKMAIIYTVEDEMVYILRIMPQSMIVY